MTTSFPNLNADYFEDDSMFPETETCLMIGGPKHGQYMEVVRGDPTHKVIVQSRNPLWLSNEPPIEVNGSGAATIHTYIRRDLGGTIDNVRYARDIYVHDTCESPEVAQQLLMSALMADFIKGGRKVIEHESNGRGNSGA